MKKALVITYSPNHDFGGTELYSEKVINILKKQKWEVTEFSLNLRNEKPKSKTKHKVVTPLIKVTEKNTLSNLFNLKKAKRELDQFKKENKFDLIINNLGDGFKWEYIPTNEVLIQHYCVEKYKYGIVSKYKIINRLACFFSRCLVGFKNYLLMHDNVVFFNPDNKTYATKICKKKFNEIETVDLSVLTAKQITTLKENKNRKSLIYVGRLDNTQKNIKLLVKIAKYLSCQVDVYGKGPALKKIKNKKNIKYCGFAERSEIFNVYSRYISSIIVSNYEGEPFTAIESMCSSTPIIIRNTFLNASIMLSNNNGLLLDKKLSAKKCANLINNYISRNDILNDGKNAKEFALNKYTNDLFEEKWKKILDRF